MESELEPLNPREGTPESGPPPIIQPPKPPVVWNTANVLNLVVILILAIVVASLQSNNSLQFKTLQAKVDDLQKQVDDFKAQNALQHAALQQSLQIVTANENATASKTSSQITYLQHDLHLYNITSVDEFSDIRHSLQQHDTLITRLTNHTSNAEVLDELKETKATINNQLEQTKVTVNQQIQKAQSNFTVQIKANQKELHVIETGIDQQLNKTLVQMKGMVNDASSHIYEVRQNVSNQLNLITHQVGTTVDELSETVEAAQLAITKQVVDVKDMIEQYTIVTNDKFAAENNFVKKQLAGTFVLLSLLIFLWHLTAHMRHYHQPVVQRKIMAVSCMVPIYSLTSWLSMVFPTMEPYLSSIRDCYEAYVVYTFFALLVAILSEGKTFHALIIKLALFVSEDREKVEQYSIHEKEKKDKITAAKSPNRAAITTSQEGTTTTTNNSDNVESPPDTVDSDETKPFIHTNEGTDSGEDRKRSEEEEDIPQALKKDKDNDNDDENEEETSHKPHERIKPPCPCGWNEQPFSVAKAWLYQCQALVIQFVFVKPMLTVIPSLLAISHIYDVSKEPYIVNNQINWYSPNLYIVVTQNVSVALAFYGLLSFFHGVEGELAWAHPWPKFLCIKIVVFATFWQNATIQLMSTLGWVDEAGALYIQNLLICIEMLIASIAHVYIFPHQEWDPKYDRGHGGGKHIMFRDIMAFGDFVQDMRLMVTPWQDGGGGVAPTTSGYQTISSPTTTLSLQPTPHKTHSEETLPMNTMSGSSSLHHHNMTGPGLSPTPYSPNSPEYGAVSSSQHTMTPYHQPTGNSKSMMEEGHGGQQHHFTTNTTSTTTTTTNPIVSPNKEFDSEYHNLSMIL